jgi:hypothetical protein
VGGLRLMVSNQIGHSCPELLTAALHRSRA